MIFILSLLCDKSFDLVNSKIVGFFLFIGRKVKLNSKTKRKVEVLERNVARSIVDSQKNDQSEQTSY